jgi:hypothetical protein
MDARLKLIPAFSHEDMRGSVDELPSIIQKFCTGPLRRLPGISSDTCGHYFTVSFTVFAACAPAVRTICASDCPVPASSGGIKILN